MNRRNFISIGEVTCQVLDLSAETLRTPEDVDVFIDQRSLIFPEGRIAVRGLMNEEIKLRVMVALAATYSFSEILEETTDPRGAVKGYDVIWSKWPDARSRHYDAEGRPALRVA